VCRVVVGRVRPATGQGRIRRHDDRVGIGQAGRRRHPLWPIVLAGALGGAVGLSEDKVYGKDGPEGDPVAVPKFDVKDNAPLEAWIKPVAGKLLTFRTEGAGKPNDVTLVPFYKLFGERYAIYWQLGEPPRRAR
jgi:hypothetical protein